MNHSKKYDAGKKASLDALGKTDSAVMGSSLPNGGEPRKGRKGKKGSKGGKKY